MNIFNIYKKLKIIQKLKLINRLVSNICDLKTIFSKRKAISIGRFETSASISVVVDMDLLREARENNENNENCVN